MEGTNTFSRIAGILNIVTAIILVVAIVLFWGVLSSGSFSGETSSEDSSAETSDEAVGQAAAVFVSLLFSSLVGKMIQFVANIVIEVSGRT